MGLVFFLRRCLSMTSQKTLCIQKLVETVMLPHAQENKPLLRKFQQNNDPKHSSNLVRAWFREHNLDIPEWPSQSPGLNSIKNIWVELRRSIFWSDKKIFKKYGTISQ